MLDKKEKSIAGIINKKGFTLAEVLLTLTVIGIVAAMAIPSIIANTQQQEFIVGLRKAYSTWDDALQKAATEAGCPGNLQCIVTPNTRDIDPKKLTKYFNIAKECGYQNGCFSSQVSYNMDGSGTRSDGYKTANGRYKFTTANGMHSWLGLVNWGCTNPYNQPSNMPTSQLCGDVTIDINGDKGPNNIGRDIFHFWITNGKGPMLYPIGSIDEPIYGYFRTSGGCGITSNDGDKCAARVFEENWQMNY